MADGTETPVVERPSGEDALSGAVVQEYPERGGGGRLTCDFCAHRCTLAPGQVGVCGIRENRDGRLVTTTWGRIVAAAVDPIEKKPLYHFYPGSTAFSIALAGCNFRCKFCQNASIAFPELFERNNEFWDVEDFLAAWRSSGSPTIAYTYSEPTVWQDYLIRTAVPARAEGARTVMVTNGFMTPEAVDRLAPVVDGFNIDLKGDDAFYRSLCRGRHDPVVDMITRVADSGRHIEVTTMVIPSRHTPGILDELAREIAEAGVQVWHLSRFHPAWRMLDEPATSESFLRDTILRLRERWSDEIPFIYGGNSRQREYLRTECPQCGRLCIDRNGRGRDLTDHGLCPSCGTAIYGLFE